MDTKNNKIVNIFLWIKNNWQLTLFSLGIVYIVLIVGLSFYQTSLYPQIISVSPENQEKNVSINSNILFTFDRNINKKDFSINLTPTTKDVTLSSKDNVLNIKPSELIGKTIYYVELFYKRKSVAQIKFATEGTSILSIMGYDVTFSTDLYDIFIDENTVVAYIRKEPYNENKKLTEDFLRNEYPNKYESLRITWIAPLPENELSWEDLTKENPDGAP